MPTDLNFARLWKGVRPTRNANMSRIPSGLTALFLSLVFHGLLGSLFWSLTVHRGERSDSHPLEVDTCVMARAGAGHVTYAEPRVLPPVLVQPASAQLPPPVTHAVSDGPATPAVATPAGHAKGSGGNTGESGSGSSGAGAGTIHFFQIASAARSIVYVLDRSSSMGLNGSLASARKELENSLEQLPPTTRFQIIVYNRTAQRLRIHGRTELALATPENIHEAVALLQALYAEGDTEHVAALKLALLLEPEVIFFLTDAAELRPEQVRAVTLLNRGRSVIHAVELASAGSAEGETSLQVLARENSGVYKSVVPIP
jgi:hypothetical protein